MEISTSILLSIQAVVSLAGMWITRHALVSGKFIFTALINQTIWTVFAFLVTRSRPDIPDSLIRLFGLVLSREFIQGWAVAVSLHMTVAAVATVVESRRMEHRIMRIISQAKQGLS